jgi:hypothetical protein
MVEVGALLDHGHPRSCSPSRRVNLADRRRIVAPPRTGAWGQGDIGFHTYNTTVVLFIYELPHWDVPKSRHVVAAPMPSAGKHPGNWRSVGGIPLTLPRSELAQFLADDKAKWRKIAEFVGITPE